MLQPKNVQWSLVQQNNEYEDHTQPGKICEMCFGEPPESTTSESPVMFGRLQKYPKL